MRHVLSLLVLTLSGCGSTSWSVWPQSTPTCCDDSTCSECSLGTADSVSLEPAPIYESPMGEIPMIQQRLDPAPAADSLPDLDSDLDSDLDAESMPAPMPDPAT